jgi:signal transduction histidine kinase
MSPADRCTQSASAVNIEDMDESAAQSANEQGRAARIRAATLGQLGAQIAHDFNNVLAVALTSIEMAMRVGDPEKANLFLCNALKVIGRGRTLTDRLAAASYACESMAAVDIHVLLSRLSNEVMAAPATRVRLLAELDALQSTVKADPDFIEEALRNLLVNARDAIAGEGALTVTTRNAPGAELRAEAGREYLVVTIKDTGAGMSDDVRNQAIELFYSTKPTEVGRGIGLAQAKDAVRRSGGVLKIDSRAGEGTTVTLAIPLFAMID